MTSNLSTTQLERELLAIVLRDKMTLQRIHSSLKDSWMTDPARKFILEKVKEAFLSSRSIISKEGLTYELEKSFNVQSQSQIINSYLAEMECVLTFPTEQNADILMTMLSEADLGRGIQDVVMEIIYDVQKGSVTEALSKLKAGAISLNSNKIKEEVIALHGGAKLWMGEVLKRREHPELYAGIKTGFQRFDQITGGLFKAELTIVFGLAGKGKSTVMKNLGVNIRRSGRNVLHVTNEENAFQVQTKYHTLDYAKEKLATSGEPIEYRRFKRGEVTDTDVSNWQAYNESQCQKEGEIFILEIPQFTDATSIERAFIELKMKGKRVDAIIIDYMDLMAPIHKAYSENDEQAKVTNDCKQLAVSCDVPVVGATQAASNTEKQETKERPFLTAADIYGTKRKAHAANTLLGIVNRTATTAVTEKSIEARRLHKVVFCVPKNRDGPTFTFRQDMDTPTGVISDDKDEPCPAADQAEAAVIKSMDDVTEIEAKEEVKKKPSEIVAVEFGRKNIDAAMAAATAATKLEAAPKVEPDVEKVEIVEPENPKNFVEVQDTSNYKFEPLEEVERGSTEWGNSFGNFKTH